MRKVFLDTETTGLDPLRDRVVEIAAITYKDSRRLPAASGGEYHQYINPQKQMPAAALKIHGLSDEFLAGKPAFADIADAFIDYIRGSEIIIHNAEFDCNILNAELQRLNKPPLEDIAASILCSLQWSRRNNAVLGMHNLKALCRFFDVGLEEGEQYHSAITDTRLLGELYFRMTQRQTEMDMAVPPPTVDTGGKPIPIKRIEPTAAEYDAHNALLADMLKETGVTPLYQRLYRDSDNS